MSLQGTLCSALLVLASIGQAEKQNSDGLPVSGIVRNLWTTEGIAGAKVELFNYQRGNLLDTATSGANGTYVVYALDEFALLTIRYTHGEGGFNAEVQRFLRASNKTL